MSSVEVQTFNAAIYDCNGILCVNVVSLSVEIFKIILSLSYKQLEFIDFYGKGAVLISQAIDIRNSNLEMSTNFLLNALTIFSTIFTSIKNISQDVITVCEIKPLISQVDIVVPPLEVEHFDDVNIKNELLTDIDKTNVPKTMPINYKKALQTIPKKESPLNFKKGLLIGDRFSKAHSVLNTEYIKNHVKSTFITKTFRETELMDKLEEYRKLPNYLERITNNNSLFGKDVLQDKFGEWNNLVFDILLYRDQFENGEPIYERTERYEFNVEFINRNKVFLIQKFHHNNKTDTTVKLVRLVEINLK